MDKKNKGAVTNKKSPMKKEPSAQSMDIPPQRLQEQKASTFFNNARRFYEKKNY